MTADPALEGSTDPSDAIVLARYRQLYTEQERQVATLPDDERSAANWLAIVAELDAPRPGVLERSFRRVGVSDRIARLLFATPALRRGWFIASACALVFAQIAANPDRGAENPVPFLWLAPLIPMIGVALAYGRGVDPMYEMGRPLPLSGIRLVMLRTAMVALVSLPVLALASLAIPSGITIGMWLLPALAMSAACLALTTIVTSRLAATIVGVGWTVLVAVLANVGQTTLAGFGVGFQVTMVAVVAAAAIVVVVRRREFEVAAR